MQKTWKKEACEGKWITESLASKCPSNVCSWYTNGSHYKMCSIVTILLISYTFVLVKIVIIPIQYFMIGQAYHNTLV